MIDIICKELTSELGNRVLFTDVLGGLVTPIQVTDNGKPKTIPVSVNEKTVCNPSDFNSLLPDSKKKSIIFCEKVGNVDLTPLGTQCYIAESKVKLTVWYNLNLINEGKYISEDIVASNIVSQIPTKLSDTLFTHVKNVHIFVDSVGGEPFAGYTMEESRTQYKTFPYGAFVVNLSISYVLNKCATTIVPSAGCNNSGGTGGGTELIKRTPIVTSMTTTASNKIKITFNYTVVNPSTFLSDFTVKINDTEATCTSVSYGAYDNTYSLTIAETIANGDEVLCSIAKGNIRAYLSKVTGQTSDTLLEEVIDYEVTNTL